MCSGDVGGVSSNDQAQCSVVGMKECMQAVRRCLRLAQAKCANARACEMFASEKENMGNADDHDD